MPTRCAIIGSGNIGTDLMMKILRSDRLELAAPIGIDPASDGLARARSLGVEATPNGISWVSEHRDEVDLVLDATSAYVHVRHATVLADLGMPVIDLTPAARGPKVIPTVNLAEHLDAPNVNMVTCGGQATTPIVAAVSQAADVPYAEMVSTVASVSAGPGTRQNIDEFTRTTARALEEIGGAALGKAKDLGLEAVGFLMMAHMISPEELLAQAGKMQDYGADLVYCVDSAGAMTTPMARDRDRGAGRRAGDPGRHPRPRTRRWSTAPP